MSLALRKISCVVLALVSLGAGTSARAQENDAWAKGNLAYAAGNFRDAAELYQTLVRAGQTSAALFYNLGNARYRNSELGEAILDYERALALEPRHPEATANLSMAQDRARALELKRNRLENWVAHFTVMQFSIAAAVAFWVWMFLLAGWFFSRRRSILMLTGVVCALLVFAAAAYGGYALETGPNGRALAIVTAKATDARLATADNAGTVLTLPPGSEIKILSTRGDWSYAALPNDLRGWIPAKNAERVRL
ncbi:MAG: tetratricopeptide repeat protein [Chthoniobacterales bacterium]